MNLVSSALPLPSDQPVNQNVLATETPSPAPATPQPKEQSQDDGHETRFRFWASRRSRSRRPVPKTTPQQPPSEAGQPGAVRRAGGQFDAARDYRADHNRWADLGERRRFWQPVSAWYVDGINRKMSQTWNKARVDPRTPKGARVYLIFTIHRDGSPADVQLDRSSGSPTLDRSCVRGVQRVDTFGNLPPGYNSEHLKVSYYCEY